MKKVCFSGITILVLIGILTLNAFAEGISSTTLKSVSSNIWFSNQNSNSYYVNWSASTTATQNYPKIQVTSFIDKDDVNQSRNLKNCYETSICNVTGQNTGDKSKSATWRITSKHSLINENDKIVDEAYSYDSAQWTPGIEPESVGKKHEERLDKFREAVKSDFLRTFNISLDGYTRLNEEQLVPILNGNKTLLNYYFSIDLDVGDIHPYVYMNGNKNHIYILQKKNDGTNILHELALSDEQWELVTKESKESNYFTVDDVVGLK